MRLNLKRFFHFKLDTEGFTLDSDQIHAFALYGPARACVGVGIKNK